MIQKGLNSKEGNTKQISPSLEIDEQANKNKEREK